jgi:ribosomal protein S18 acetylase RimI-like enzyme
MIFTYISVAILITAFGIYYTQRKGYLLKAAFSKSKNKKDPHLPYIIRSADANDIEIIRNLALEIWPKTYDKTFSPQQVIYMLNSMFSKDALIKQMKDNHKYSIIYSGHLPIGFTSLSEVLPSIYKLHKIYILPAFQGLGAGKFVMDHIIEEIRPQNATALILNVNKHSPAKAFYEHLGFRIAKAEDTEVGNGYYINDYVMELRFDTKTAFQAKEKMMQA